MLVFWKPRLVVLSTPKTGTTAIEEALGALAALAVTRPAALKHSSAAQWQTFLRPYLRATSGAEFTAVALMRDPVDWLGSWYRHRLRDDIAEMPGATRGMGFARFVEDYLSTPCPPHADVGSQAAFLRGADGAPCGVDRLFRYEAIEDFTAYLEDLLDFPVELPRLNVSPEEDLTLPPALAERLNAHLAADHALYRSIG